MESDVSSLKRRLSAGFVRDMLVSGVLPWVCVLVLQRLHVPLVRALAISTIFPIADGIYSFVRFRRVDAIGIVNLCFLAGSIALALWSGDVHVALLKGIALTGIFSLVCLGSLLAPKPLMFYLSRGMTTRGDPALIAEFTGRWQFARFRRIMRIITAVWGVAYLLEVAVRIVLAYSLPPLTVVATAPLVTYGVLGALVLWTIAYSSAMRRKYAAYVPAPEAAA